MVKQMTSCCCGCSLRTGTIIIAVLGILAGVGVIVNGALGPQLKFKPWLNISNSISNTISNTINNITNLDNSDVGQNSSLEDTDNTEMSNATRTLMNIKNFLKSRNFLLIYQEITGVLSVLLGGMLLVGAIMEKRTLVYPWVVKNVIICAATLIVNLILTIVFVDVGGWVAGVIYIIIVLISTMIYVYLILVVYSFYNTLLISSPGTDA